MGFFHQVFAVDFSDGEIISRSLKIPVATVGDTKYDRAFERMRQSQLRIASISSCVEGVLGTTKRRMILGSAWRPEVLAFCEAADALQVLSAGWGVIIAPHDVSEAMLRFVENQCDKNQWRVLRFSEAAQRTQEIPDDNWDVLLIDQMGYLAEMYASADCAFIGGGMDRRVHNVLEPACFGLPLAFGPNFDTSAEARRMVDLDIATVVSNSNELKYWWRKHFDQEYSRQISHETRDFVHKMCGASDRIYSALRL